MRLSLSFQDAAIEPPSDKNARYAEALQERTAEIIEAHAVETNIVATALLFERTEFTTPSLGHLEDDALEAAFNHYKARLTPAEFQEWHAWTLEQEAPALEQALFDRIQRQRLARALSERKPSPHMERINEILSETAHFAVVLTPQQIGRALRDAA